MNLDDIRALVALAQSRGFRVAPEDADVLANPVDRQTPDGYVDARYVVTALAREASEWIERNPNGS